VHILCNDEDIPLSPFMAWVEAPGNFDPNKVKNSIVLICLKLTKNKI
jgi:hypothetical protein